MTPPPQCPQPYDRLSINAEEVQSSTGEHLIPNMTGNIPTKLRLPVCDWRASRWSRPWPRRSHCLSGTFWDLFPESAKTTFSCERELLRTSALRRESNALQTEACKCSQLYGGPSEPPPDGWSFRGFDHVGRVLTADSPLRTPASADPRTRTP